jgi:Secretion system C-terminal sorting domain
MQKFTRFKCFMLLMVGLLTAGSGAIAQNREWVGIPTTVGMGVTVSVAELAEASARYDLNPTPKKLRRELEYRRRARSTPNGLKVSSWPPGNPLAPAQDNLRSITATQSIYSNFLANNFSEAAVFPPDSNGDVGPSQIVIASNSRIKVYNKNNVCTGQQTTTLGASSTNLASPVLNVDVDTFFSPGTGGVSVSDPHVRYDRLSQRWFIIAIDLRAAPNRCVIAVSSGPTIVNAASFTFFFFVFDTLAPVPAAFVSGFFDYPTLGVDANALYIGGRMFNNALTSYVGASVFVVRKSSILGAGPMVVTGFNGIGGSGTGIYTPQGVHNDDPAATTGYIIGVSAAVFNQLDFHRISTPGGTPSASLLIPVAVPTTSSPLNPVAGGNGVTLDANDDRLFAAMVMKNTQTGVSTLWTSHNIAVNNAGVGFTSGAGRRTGLRWYQLGNLNAAPTLIQSGTVFDNAATNPRFYWFPSIATSGQGHSVIASSTCAVNQFIDVAVAGRYNTDALGTTQPPILATASTTVYAPPGDPGPGRRWGDYSQTVVDPSNNMTMWTFQTYTTNTNTWGLRATQLAAPPPATPNPPGTVACGNNVGPNRVSTVTITGTSTNNSGFYDPGADAGGPGFANRLGVSSTGGATTSGITFTSPTSISFTLTWPASLAGTTQTLTITNPDCQRVTVNYTLPTGCINLAAKLVSFTGRDIGRKVLLDWKTADETSNAYFVVQRSSNGNNFTDLARVENKNPAGADYQLADPNPLPVNYYRLKMVSLSGEDKYSDVVVITIKGKNDFSLFPNPASSTLTVNYAGFFRNGNLTIFSASGEKVLSRNITNAYTSVDVSALSSGVYFVELQAPDGRRQRQQVVIERKEP